MSILQLVDSSDAVLFDFDDSTGANNPEAVTTELRAEGFALSSVETEIETFSPETLPGGRLLRARTALARSSFLLGVNATTVDKFIAAVGELARLLQNGGILKWQPTGATEARYIDFIIGEVPPVFRGDIQIPALVLEKFRDVGLPITVWRQPYIRGPRLTSATNKLANPTMLLDADADGRPDSWAWDSAANISSESIQAASESYSFNIATASARSLRQSTGAGTAQPNDVWTASFYAKASAGTTARARAVIRYLDNTGTAIGSESAGTLTALATSWARLTVTSAAAPAGTDRVRIELRLENSDAASNTVHFRRGQLEEASAATKFVVATEAVANDPATGYGRVLPVFVHGDAPTPAILTVTAATDDLGTVRVARRSNGGAEGGRSLATLLNGTKFAQCDTGTMGTDTSSVADAAASGGNTAETTYSTRASMSKRVTVAVSSGLNALRDGAWDVYVRVKASALENEHKLQLRWALVSAPAVTDVTVEPEVVFPGNGGDQTDYVDLRLGRITIPDKAIAAATLELWSERTLGSGNLRWDALAFVPAGEASSAVTLSPGRGAATNQKFLIDADARRFDLLDSSDQFRAPLLVEGPAPVMLQPGLNLLHLGFGDKRARKSLSFVNANNANGGGAVTSITITKPTNTREGDILVAFVSGGATGTTYAAPSGWTRQLLADSTAGASIGAAAVFYKVAGPSEPASYTFSGSAAGSLVGIVATYRFDHHPPFGAPSDNTGNSSTPRGLSIPTDVDRALALWLAFASGSVTVTPPAGYTSRSSINSGNGSAGFADKEYAAAGETGNQDGSLSGSSTWRVVHLPLNAAGTTHPPSTLGRVDTVKVEYAPRYHA